MHLSKLIAIIYDKKCQDSLILKVSFLNQIEIYTGTCVSQMIVVSNFIFFYCLIGLILQYSLAGATSCTTCPAGYACLSGSQTACTVSSPQMKE